MLWWAWTGYAWLTSVVDPEEGAVRLVIFGAMAALLLVSLCVPEAFGSLALPFALIYGVVRAAQIALFMLASPDDDGLRHSVLGLAVSSLIAVSLLALASLFDGLAQGALWALALFLDMAGPYFFGADGWKLVPGHFAERHGLIVIIALGESIVALGVGAGGLELDAGLITAALLGIAIASAMWWAYFDFVALIAERRLRTAPPSEQVRIARDSFTYLHLPMVAGIVVFALGVKKTLAHVDHELDTVPAVALCCGAALYFLALSAFKRRNIGSFNYPRLVAASALVVLAPIATAIPALLAVGLVAAISVALVSYEFVAYAEARDRIRHASP
jgi:low temperature requirement protein LtrA